MRSWERTWHLIFLAHIWALSPFAFLWLNNPKVARQLEPGNMASMRWFTLAVLAYFGVRTFLAFKNPRWLKWQLVYPPIDVALVTFMLYIGDKDPLGNITIMYFLPIAEAAGTLNVVYAAAIGVLSVIGSILASVDLIGWEKPYNIAFRFLFLLVMSSLFTFLARRASEFRGRAQVAADRNRLALEMHDGVQAQLIAAASQIELIQRLATKDPNRAGEVAGEARGTLRQAADELRFLVQRLRTPAMGEGFLPALRQYAHNFCERFGLELNFASEGRPTNIDAEQENVLFRIAQESLTNIVKHAKAKTVDVYVCFRDHEAVIAVADDGCGMAEGEAANGHVGLESMAERAKSVGGSISVRPNDSQGTRVEATIPLGRRMKSHV
ncbi:MAG TPA: sensor histidine kinase [Fimbriimonadaceae bacterium]|nr:sensor histidine kinase [Fimbriimonadaceae bacterium]